MMMYHRISIAWTDASESAGPDRPVVRRPAASGDSSSRSILLLSGAPVLLGESDGSSFVWAECFGALGGTSAPMRVDGDEVQVPGDGDIYSDDVRRLFPAEIADAILTDQERLKP